MDSFMENYDVRSTMRKCGNTVTSRDKSFISDVELENHKLAYSFRKNVFSHNYL